MDCNKIKWIIIPKINFKKYNFIPGAIIRLRSGYLKVDNNLIYL